MKGGGGGGRSAGLDVVRRAGGGGVLACITARLSVTFHPVLRLFAGKLASGVVSNRV